jgi:hypothetical protein
MTCPLPIGVKFDKPSVNFEGSNEGISEEFWSNAHNASAAESES